MILWIIFGLITLIGILFLVLGIVGVYSDGCQDENSTIAGGVLLGFGGIACIALAIVTIVVNACPEVQLNEWEENVVYLQNEKAKLESFKLVTDGTKTEFTSDITFETVSTNKYYEMVNDYNKEVRSFKVEMKNGKALRKNPWVNCLSWKAYEMFDLTLLDNLEYSIGK